MAALPNSNISTSLVANTLQTSSHDVGTLCTHSSINEDSLFKPYEVASPTNPSFLTGGPDGFYGYSIPSTTSSNVLSFRGQMWSFNPPTTCYRLGDFRGYDHTVDYDTNPWGVSLISDDPEDTIRISCTFGGVPGLVSPKNMDCFDGYYFAVQVWGGTSDMTASLQHRWSQCCNNSISESHGELITINNTFNDEVLIIVPFLSQYKFTAGSDASTTGGYLKYCMNYKTNQTLRISNLPPTLYAIHSHNITSNSTNSVKVDLSLYKYITQLTLYTAYLSIELYDGANCGGNRIYSNVGTYDNTVFKYSTPITFEQNVLTLPSAIVGWDPKYNSTTAYWNKAASIRVHWEDPYNQYTYVVGEFNIS